MLVAGWGVTAPGETSRPHVGRVAELEATLAATVTSMAVDAVAVASTATGANSIGAHRSPTASVTVVVPEPIYNFAQGLVIAGAAALLAPAWYLGFPVTLTGSAAFLVVLLRPFVAAAGGTMTPILTGSAVLIGALIYALLPPALVVAGLVQAGSAISRSLTAPGAATKSDARATVASDVPTATGRSGRGTAGPRTRPAKTVPGRTAPTAAVAPAKERGGSPTSNASSKKSTGNGVAKRAVGGSGRNR
ncbi:hypothetical protein MAIC_47800 [Mycolicibacterium aichiense]|uniref:Transmembrane protein n=2 Tax=Mycolicibacterium aichiense TaxID=1799 RepID=A0AAD1MCX8_9MYCO|nr:hypothetical protein MAIC_47800 [Mycolicibacterium aichiense]